ncbi:hypothetical protein AVEN_65279-1 [Araneus ventricosus]|uniref:Uncharacterized protein n=1 Tax=Araneus ventricosus TaxID=182803 RepID=A0A4Y2AFZ4_ARAVE|nr:hypothetical protein AVEN_65279-1 [Araneus ventricosus]
MKTRLKKKTDLNKTGNKAIKLLDWEKHLLKAMDGDSNPTSGEFAGPYRLVFMKTNLFSKDGVNQLHREEGVKASPEQSCSGVTDVEPPQNLLPLKKKLASAKGMKQMNLEH